MKKNFIATIRNKLYARASAFALLFMGLAGFLSPAAAQKIPWPLNPTTEIHRIFASYGNYDDGINSKGQYIGDIHFHEGLDILPTPGADSSKYVIACEDGFVGEDPGSVPEDDAHLNKDGYMRHVLVTRGFNNTTEALVYMHCDFGYTNSRNLKNGEAKRKWREGDSVKKGDVLGTIAVRKGLREHLHFGWQSKKANEKWSVINPGVVEYAGNPIDILTPTAKNNRPVVFPPVYMDILGNQLKTKLYDKKTTVIQANVDMAAKMYDRFGPNNTAVFDINVKKVEWFAGIITQCACAHIPRQTPIDFTGKFLAAATPDKGRNFYSKFHDRFLVHTIYCDRPFAKSVPRNVATNAKNVGVYFMYLTNIDRKNDSLEAADGDYFWNTSAKEGTVWNISGIQNTARSNKEASTPDGRYRIGIIATGHAGENDKTEISDTVFINNFDELIYSCSNNGTVKDTFCKDEAVYIKGEGFPKSWTFKVSVIKHQAWADGTVIPTNNKRVAMAEVTTDENGLIKPTLIWNGYQPNGTPDAGYDIVLDYDDDGVYSEPKMEKVTDPIDLGALKKPGITGSTLKANSTRKHVSCNGLCDGKLTVVASGGKPPYTYKYEQKNPGVLTPGPNVRDKLCAGYYYTQVVDANGCTFDVYDTITEPAKLVLQKTAVNATCAGKCDGKVSLTASGGTPPYTFTPGQNITGLCAGWAKFSVKDKNGCMVSDSVLITEPAALNLNAHAGNVTSNGTCPENCDGWFTASASGGTPPYTYSPAQSMTGLCPGSYAVSVTGSNGCSSSATVIIRDTAGTLDITATSTNVNCHGECTGSMYATATGGTAPYSYYPSQTLTDLCAGTYTITVTDANGCTRYITKTITEPSAPLTIAGTATSAICGSCNGSVSVTASGGTPPYFYSPAQTMTGLCPGLYTVSVTDSYGCTSYTNITVSDTADALDITATSTDVGCYGECTGSMTATVTGGTAPYMYYPAQTLTDLCAGAHTITVTDANGCTQSITKTITQPSAPLTAFSTATSTACGSCNGTVSATASGGTPPYTYWPSQSLTGLCAGFHSISVTDANGCTAYTTATVTDSSSAILVSLTGTNAGCGSCNGSVSATAWGGTPPYTYSPAQNLAELCPGTYTITVTDANGCTGWGSYSFGGDSAFISVTGTVTNDSCGACSGSISASAFGGTPPYTFLPSSQLTGICAGGYFITVTDANNCSGTGMFTVLNMCDTIFIDTIKTDTLVLITKKPAPAKDELSIAGIHPNPFQGSFSAVLHVPSAGILRYRLMTADGAVVLQQTVQVHKGLNNVLIREKNPLPPGTYIFEMQMAGKRTREILIRQ
jgi:SprB repeat